MLGKWLPVQERSSLSALVFNGNQFGTIITLATSGFVAEKLGWEAIFYILGGLGMVIGVFWVFLVRESPHQHPSISQVHFTKFIELRLIDSNYRYVPNQIM